MNLILQLSRFELCYGLQQLVVLVPLQPELHLHHDQLAGEIQRLPLNHTVEIGQVALT